LTGDWVIATVYSNFLQESASQLLPTTPAGILAVAPPAVICNAKAIC
jgi:hypothetical protein